MKLKHGLHLAYCTNIHRGETWAETFETLRVHTLAVRDRVSPHQPYAIGLRLGEPTARELSEPAVLLQFQRWLDRENCYVFTINGFPYSRFHGDRVKESVYAPDWTTDARVEYTNRLFDLLSQLVPSGIAGSVSTVPLSFKPFITTQEQVQALGRQVWRTVEHIAKVSEKSGRELHLGLEPEPLCYLETTAETVSFFETLRQDHPNDPRLARHLGVNYDACHLAVEYENPAEALGQLKQHGIKVSKLHFSSALKVRPNRQRRLALQSFVDRVYFHQVIERFGNGPLKRYSDLDVALAQAPEFSEDNLPEWRIHFHIPLHSQPTPLFETTADHLLGVMDVLQKDPSLCSHIEMETYTWEVLPSEIKNRNVVHQLVAEYQWTLHELQSRNLA